MHYRHLCLAVLLLVPFTGCDRDQYPGERKAAVERERLPTPKKGTKAGDAIGEATPVAAHGDDAKKVAKAEPKEAPPPVKEAPATVKEAPAVAKEAPPTKEAPKEAPTVKAAPVVASEPFKARPGSVAKGTDIREGPSADSSILGTFKGKTKVDVIGEEGTFSRVKAPTTGGKAVEGWVLTSSVSAEEAKVVKAEPAEAKPADAKPAADAKAAPAAPKAEKAAPAKAAPAKAAKAGDKGPDDINLKAIAGMTMKRSAVPFTHKKHYDDYSLKCEQCHHPVKAKGGSVPSYSCSDAGCHLEAECNGAAVGKKNKACPNFEDAYHIQCIDCHRATSGPTKCGECHI